ncbi:hypothetical protein B0H67DRAFT_644232 [Lasiosphaeris hirsuta]|uniref:Uncharacterized protein n=1 Tax=Lasiosphaeris hirsuta TaxID=260670 RepID=A0AA40ASB4_9PEZI|nr:hypothetical protein B0H67DRAFT_644232 [Lasiosphaeris hirsuta]
MRPMWLFTLAGDVGEKRPWLWRQAGWSLMATSDRKSALQWTSLAELAAARLPGSFLLTPGLAIALQRDMDAHGYGART